MRRGLAALTLLGVLLGAPPAVAQLLPTDLLRGGDAPTLRLAGGNAVADDARALSAQTQTLLEERKPAIAAAHDALNEEIKRLEAASIKDPQARRELALAQRLDEAYERERALLERSKLLADQALQSATTTPEPPAGPIGLDSLVSLVRESRTAQQQALAATSAADQTDELADWSRGVALPGSLAERLRTQRRRVLAASATHTRAKALVAQADAFRTASLVEVSLPALEVTTADIEQLRRSVTEGEQSLAAARKHWASEREEQEKVLAAADQGAAPSVRDAQRALVLARLELIDRRQEEDESELALARVRLAVADTITQRKRVIPGELDRTPLAVRLTALDQLQTAISATRSNLQDRIPAESDSGVRSLLAKQDGVLAETLLSLGRTRAHVADAQIYADLARRIVFGSPRPYPAWLAALMSVLFIGLMVFVWIWGHRRLMRATGDDSRIVGRLGLQPLGSARLSIAIGVLWFAVAVAATGAVTIWGIWRLDMSVGEAIRIIDYPLFFLDERGISAFSVIKFAVALVVASVLSRLLRRALQRRLYPALQLDVGLTNALNTLIKYTFFTAGFLVGLYFVGIGLSSLALLAGVLGIGLGFGMRNIAENFISGLMILIERPVKIGDWIDIDGTIEGQVRSIRARSTTVVTRDNISVIIPNSEFISRRVTNWSHGDPKVRVKVPIGVAYGSDVQLVRKVLLEVAEAHGKVLRKPAPVVHFVGFGDSSLNFYLLVWIDQQEVRDRILSDLRFAVDATFRRHRVEIPFPQRTLHVQTLPPALIEAMREPEAPPEETPPPGPAPSTAGASPDASRPESPAGAAPPAPKAKPKPETS